MYKVYALLMLACTPSMMFSMEEGATALVVEQAQVEQKRFFEALLYPAREGNSTYIKQQVRSNPDYVTLVDKSFGCSPLWTLVGSLMQARVDSSRKSSNAEVAAETLREWYPESLSKGQESESTDLVSIYRDLFLFFLNEGAEIDFTAAPVSLNLSAEEDPQELRDVWYNFIWRKARKMLVECDGEKLSTYLDRYPILLSFVSTDTKTTLLHEAASALGGNKKAFGLFRLLLRKGANYQVPNGENVTVADLMSLDAQPRHKGADLFNSEANRSKAHEFNLGTVLPPEKIKGFFAGMYGKALPYKEYIVGAGGLIFMGYLMFGGSSLERPPLDAKVLG